MTRILLITRNLPPLVGGMERLNWHIAHELTGWAEVKAISPSGSALHAPDNVEVIEVPLNPLWRFLGASAFQAARTARQWRPDIVLAGSGLTAPAALLAARASKARAGVYLHGLDVAVRHPIYRALWHPAIRRMDCAIVNSSPTLELARAVGVSDDKMHIIHPGVQIPNTSQSASALQSFRQRHNLGSARILLSVGRLTTRKGLREFIEHALPTIVRSAPDTLLAIVGEAPTSALHARAQSRESIQAAADATGVSQHLRFIGVITDKTELACAYESASLHVFPVRQIPGDPEGFGMVAIEAAAHGVPTAAFATGGVVDAVVDRQSGRLVAPGDYAALAQAVLSILSDTQHTWQINCRAFSERFAWQALGQKMRRALVNDDLSPLTAPTIKK